MVLSLSLFCFASGSACFTTSCRPAPTLSTPDSYVHALSTTSDRLRYRAALSRRLIPDDGRVVSPRAPFLKFNLAWRSRLLRERGLFHYLSFELLHGRSVCDKPRQQQQLPPSLRDPLYYQLPAVQRPSRVHSTLRSTVSLQRTVRLEHSTSSRGFFSFTFTPHLLVSFVVLLDVEWTCQRCAVKDKNLAHDIVPVGPSPWSSSTN